VLRRFASDRISRADLINEMNEALTMPGVISTWSSPIRGRIDMLSTGVRSPIGIKIAGQSVEAVERIGEQIAAVLRPLPETRSVFAERIEQGRFLDVRWDRAALADAGIAVDDAQAVVQYAIGGENVSEIVDGRERYPVAVRYAADFRSDPESLKRILVPDSRSQRQVPIADLADVRTTAGPAMMRNENGLLTGYVYVDTFATDLEGYVSTADRAIRDRIRLPPGVSISWTGQYQEMLATEQQLYTVVPLTLALIVLLLYVNTRSFPKTLIVLLAVPFSAIGAVWAVYVMGYQMSAAVWVGLIALLGVDAETGVFMLLYLDDAFDRAKQANQLDSPEALRHAILEGASRRVRPKFMTVATMFVGLLPIMWSEGPGAAVMQRIAAPLIGGILTSFLLELIVYPPLYHSWKSRELMFVKLSPPHSP
jgi:Cu(I)/Ag(I) efflux system membrane protein CusA/SilA